MASDVFKKATRFKVFNIPKLFYFPVFTVRGWSEGLDRGCSGVEVKTDLRTPTLINKSVTSVNAINRNEFFIIRELAWLMEDRKCLPYIAHSIYEFVVQYFNTLLFCLVFFGKKNPHHGMIVFSVYTIATPLSWPLEGCFFR